MRTELMLVGYATLLCILSAIVMFWEGEIVALTAFIVVGMGCAELMYKTIKDDL